MATLAHELRNLLSPLSCALKILELGRDDEQLVTRTLPMAQRQVAHMTYLVNELMDVGRIVNDHLHLQLQRQDLRTIVSDTLQAVGPSMERQTLAADLPAEPLWIEADPVRLTQVLSNLLHNAAKFTPAGGHVRVRVFEEAGGAAFSVSDDGLGIDPAELENIFAMFKQVDRSRTLSRDGLGIGLALARTIVELHGGQVRAFSEGVGKGSEFTVRLPLAAAVIQGQG